MECLVFQFKEGYILSKKGLTLQKAMEIAQSMEAATKQSSKFCTPSRYVSASQNIKFTITGKTCYKCESKRHSQENCHFNMQKIM